MQVVNQDTGEILDNAQIFSEEPVSKAKGGNRSRENEDFVMLYRHFIKQIADLGLENPTALRVLLFLIRHMDGMNAIGVQQTLIADMTGLVRQTVSKSISYLQENGWIQVFKLGRSNIYVINPQVVWTSYAGQKSYCKFQGSLMLSSDDQWDIRKPDKSQIKYLDPLMAARMAEVEFPESPASADGEKA